MTQQGLFGNGEIHTYLLTIREGSAEALMSRKKPHEFRRKFDRYDGKARIFLYVTRPVGKVIGQVIFGSPIIDSVDSLCALLVENEHDTEGGVRKYLAGCQLAYALPVLDVKRFDNPISLEELRRDNFGFNPPMSFIKLDKPKYHSLRDYLVKRG